MTRKVALVLFPKKYLGEASATGKEQGGFIPLNPLFFTNIKPQFPSPICKSCQGQWQWQISPDAWGSAKRSLLHFFLCHIKGHRDLNYSWVYLVWILPLLPSPPFQKHSRHNDQKRIKISFINGLNTAGIWGPSEASFVLSEVTVAEPTAQGSLDLPTPSQTEAGMCRAESCLGPPRAGPAGSVYCM